MNAEHTDENQMGLPIIEIVGKETISFPRLELDELITWAVEVGTVRRNEAEQRYKADTTLSPFDRQRLLQDLIDYGVQLNLLLNRANQPAGVRKVLVMSLKKGGKDDAAALAILKRIHYQRQANLAFEVLAPPAAPEPPKDGAPPLSLAAENGSSS